MHQCIEFMVSFVEQISGQSLCCHILSLCDVMKETLQKEIPLQFALVFDVSTEGTHHYIGVAASYFMVDAMETACQTTLGEQPLLAD
jgi:hypothetical protein